MDGPSDPLMFLAMAAFISLSGALMPGPMFATALSQGLHDSKAGLKLTVGHALVEVPLIIAIFFGLEAVLRDETVFALIGIVGGAFLLYMGASMFKAKPEAAGLGSKHGSYVAGVVLTVVNPYFLLWWATVGASLVILASAFGPVIIPLFVAVHLACDFGWQYFVSFTVHRFRTFWTGNRYRLLYGVSGIILVFFALYFIYSAMETFVG